MAYRIKAMFRDGVATWQLADIVAGPTPRRGDTVHVSRHGHEISLQVTAIHTPTAGIGENGKETVMTVEAQEL